MEIEIFFGERSENLPEGLISYRRCNKNPFLILDFFAVRWDSQAGILDKKRGLKRGI